MELLYKVLPAVDGMEMPAIAENNISLDLAHLDMRSTSWKAGEDVVVRLKHQIACTCS
jgi:hypothetical protein